MRRKDFFLAVPFEKSIEVSIQICLGPGDLKMRSDISSFTKFGGSLPLQPSPLRCAWGQHEQAWQLVHFDHIDMSLKFYEGLSA